MNTYLRGKIRLTAQQLAASPDLSALARLEYGVESGQAGPGRGHKTDDNSTRFSKGSTSAAYLVARLKRDHPEVAERLAAEVCRDFCEA